MKLALEHVVLIKNIYTEDGDSGGPAYTIDWVYVKRRPIPRITLTGILVARTHYAEFISVNGIEPIAGVRPMTF